MHSSFEITFTCIPTLIAGFRAQGLTATQIAPNQLQVSGGDWHNVIVNVKTPVPGSPGENVISVGTDGGIPPFGCVDRGLRAAMGR